MALDNKQIATFAAAGVLAVGAIIGLATKVVEGELPDAGIALDGGLPSYCSGHTDGMQGCSDTDPDCQPDPCLEPK